MDNKQTQSRIVLLLFVLLVCLDWLYVFWIKSQPNMFNAWFVLIPLMTYFYFTFALIASIGLYYQKRFGLTIAYGVIMSGTIASAMSYTFIFKNYPTIASMFVLLILINFAIILYMASKRDYFQMD